MTKLIRHTVVTAKAQTKIRQPASKNAAIFNENAFCYLKVIIKETLNVVRSCTPIGTTTDLECCQVLSYTIPSGVLVIVNARSLGPNPDYWNNPEEFNPETVEVYSITFQGQNSETAPFGAGRRICPVVEFAVAVVEEAPARLLLHFDWKLPDGMKPDDVDMVETFE